MIIFVRQAKKQSKGLEEILAGRLEMVMVQGKMEHKQTFPRKYIWVQRHSRARYTTPADTGDVAVLEVN